MSLPLRALPQEHEKVGHLPLSSHQVGTYPKHDLDARPVDFELVYEGADNPGDLCMFGEKLLNFCR